MPREVCVEQDAFHVKLADATLQLGFGRISVLKWQDAQTEKARRMLLRNSRDEIVCDPCDSRSVFTEPLRSRIIHAERREPYSSRIHRCELGI